MLSTYDWPPPKLIFSTSVTASLDDVDDEGSDCADTTPVHTLMDTFLACCRRPSERSEGSDKNRISQLLLGTYKMKQKDPIDQQLKLTIAPDGSLICADHVNVNMLIAGFQEFERRFQYGNLMPFANVLPSQVSISDPKRRESWNEIEAKSVLKRSKKVSFVQVESS